MATAIGIDLIVCMAAGFGIGKLFQRWFSPHPLWVVLGIMIGFFAGIISAYLLAKSQLEDKS